ncbi:PREDICTED: BURP domain protein USPL1-like [Lupinus angustifolius]|uniref:BURP domain protein USPL1-like n=1 Tax=Lupinus angustifolius TaxID=3871 RepID=UPI00092F8286|nr:PREDICTED: BURP domain protein USPL1-like [Lupinus angustifolius]
MGLKFMPCILFLHLLCCYGEQSRELAETENNLLEVPLEVGDKVSTNIQDIHHEHAHAHAHTMTHIDPSLMVFFTLKEFKVGKRMPIHFPKRDPATSPKLWPKEQADSLPFSLNRLPYLLKLFSFPPNSPQARAMQSTLSECESKPIKGEVKFCATSYESMLDFTHTIIGLNTEVQSFATFHQSKSSVTFQNYTILEILMAIPAPKMVACHTMPYPYAIFYCHNQESGNRVYKVLLDGDNGDKVEAMVVCHLDTSQWSPTHVSFQVLGVTPGTSSVCHFFPADHLIWVPRLQAHGSSTM